MITSSGTHVRKSTHQKVIEQNKKLLCDIYLLVMNPLTEENFKVKMAWRRKFKKDRQLNSIIKNSVTKNYF